MDPLYYRGSRRPLHRQSRRSLPFVPKNGLGALMCRLIPGITSPAGKAAARRVGAPGQWPGFGTHLKTPRVPSCTRRGGHRESRWKIPGRDQGDLRFLTGCPGASRMEREIRFRSTSTSRTVTITFWWTFTTSLAFFTKRFDN